MQPYINPIEQLIHSTVRIGVETTVGAGSGTGFFYGFCETVDRHIPCIVTNKHVVKGAKIGYFHLTLRDAQGKPDLGNHKRIQFDNFEGMWIGHPDPNIDLAIFPIAPILAEARTQKINFHFIRLKRDNLASAELLSSLPTMEEIVMIGYPNGLWDAKHNLPIIRRGITSTHPRLPLDGKPEFLIDAACFPGSSGSPIFLANIGHFVNSEGNLCAGTRIALLGILYAGPQHTAAGEIKIINVPTTNMPIALSSIPNNLGLAIQADKLNDFEEILSRFPK